MATVKFEKASRIYPGTSRPAVDSLDLDVGDGEFLVLVGPSGCGKSTSLRMLAGLEDVDQGTIYIQDRDVTNLPPKARDIAMVFQNYALYPHMTVYENMAFALKLRKMAKHEIDTRVKKAAGLLQLEEFLGRKPKALSGGQRQRVAMGRAIVREPQVFLMDEPLSNLDAKLRVQTRSQIATLKLVPLTEGGAKFAEMELPLTREQTEKARADGGSSHVQMGFRPEDTDLVGADSGGMPIHVDLVEELGSDAYVYGTVALEGQDERFVVRADPRSAPQLNDIVYLLPRAGHHHVFHAVTGERL